MLLESHTVLSFSQAFVLHSVSDRVLVPCHCCLLSWGHLIFNIIIDLCCIIFTSLDFIHPFWELPFLWLVRWLSLLWLVDRVSETKHLNFSCFDFQINCTVVFLDVLKQWTFQWKHWVYLYWGNVAGTLTNKCFNGNHMAGFKLREEVLTI